MTVTEGSCPERHYGPGRAAGRRLSGASGTLRGMCPVGTCWGYGGTEATRERAGTSRWASRLAHRQEGRFSSHQFRGHIRLKSPDRKTQTGKRCGVPGPCGRRLSSVRLAGSEIASAISSGSESYAAYTDWMAKQDIDVPVSVNTAATAAEKTHQSIVEQQTKLPSAYTDFLIPAIRDGAQDGINIFAPDFPFGPGSDKLNEDLHFQRYKYADKMRQVSAVKMATIGFETIEDYIGDEHKDENINTLEKVFQKAIKDLEKAADGGNENFEAAPFDLSSEDNYFKQMYENMQANQAFQGQLDDRIQTEDLVEALQISKTFEYVTAIMEAGAGEAGGQVMTNGRMNANVPGSVESALRKVQNGQPLNLGPASQATVAKNFENQKSVQDDTWIKKKRQELLKLYEADPQTIGRYIGYYDKYTEARRASLRDKLNDSWREWKGMRRAFPSYMLVLAGRLGTGLFDVMSDLYSWTAVQQIEMVDSSGSAGQTCQLSLSNMRKRIVGNPGEHHSTDLVGNPAFDSQMEIQPGNHMYVYTGYGPDAAHMEGFAGKVTAAEHGPVTNVTLSSYSTTLNNQPNDGKGFFVDGWDGQQSLAETILYTISQTSGLEGLGRKAPGQATDRLGRSARGFADEDYRSSLMIDLYKTLGSPGLSWMMDDKETERRAGGLLTLISKYGLDRVKSMVLGDPQIYENVWVTSSPQTSGFAGMLFGGLADYLTGGKGWGWAARPGRTAWSQLKQQAMLFPDYVTTTRPYNSHVPFSELDEHPHRQTLYFGPKSGNYIHSSREPQGTDAFSRLTEEEVDRAITSGDGTEGGDSTGGNMYDILWQEYTHMFVQQTAFKSILEMMQGGESGGALPDISEFVNETIDTMQAGTPVGAPIWKPHV